MTNVNSCALGKAIPWLSSLFFLYVICLNICKINFLFADIVFVILAFCFIGVIYRLSLKLDVRNVDIICYSLILSNCFFLTYLGCKLSVGFTWDYGQIQKTAMSFAYGHGFSNKPYYVRYPNNQFVLLSLSFYYKLICLIFGKVSSFTLLRCSIALNSFLISLSYFFYYKCCCSYIGKRFGLLLLVSLILFLPISSYSAIFYSDSVALLIPPLLLTCMNKVGCGKLRYMAYIPIVSAIGCLIKPSVIFVLLAILFYPTIQIGLYRKIMICLGCFILIWGAHCIQEKIMNISPNEKEMYEFPHTHHIMMALNVDGKGGYVQNDVDFTKSFTSKDEKKNANICEIKKRIKALGGEGLLYHLFVTKIRRTWTDCTFASSDYLGRKNFSENLWTQFVVKDRKWNHYYVSLYTIFMIIIYLGWVMPSSRNNHGIVVAKMATLFFAFFLIVWECNSRYLVHYLPMIIITGLYGWHKALRNVFKNHSANH